ncbi:MAG TPA: hypothetical protein VFW65_33135 [Pseudonocardiaceae bacterium]|nr:hypothetical protein [Pseudonocardiaceae bacterium]
MKKVLFAKSFLAGTAVAILLTAACSTYSTISSAPVGQAVATKVTVINPWVNHQIAKGFTVINDPPMACFQGSQYSDRADAISCNRSGGNDLNGDNTDPCFVDPNEDMPDSVACPVSPTTVIVAKFTPVDLIHSGVSTSVSRTAWLIVLKGGDACRSTSSIGIDPRGKLNLMMQCHSGAFVWGTPNTSKAIWTVDVSRTETSPLVVTQVTNAYK